MTSITLSWFGPPEQKHAVKVTAMQTLTDVLQAASSKFKPPLQVDMCELQLSKKPVDLRTPFRLLNVPAGSKLEVVRKVVSTAAAAPHQAAGSSIAKAAAPVPPEAVLAAAATSAPAADADAAAAPRQVAFVAPDATVTPEAAAAAAAAAAAPPQPASLHARGADRANAASSSSAAAAAQPGGSVDPALAALGVTVPVYVFHQRGLEAAAAKVPSPIEADPPDEFFELTAEDLQRLHAQAAAKRKADSVFRTRTAREAESATRASAMGPVRVRLHLPDGTLLQSDFRATDALSKVQELLRKVAAPELAAALYLYTTPPKTLLKDAAATLYSLQLVPAAHIHVGLDESKAQGSTSTGEARRHYQN
eukprot:GHRQ01031589.1.p1 GENE.GHRQ01031589.1~~GHRQ01031589.1.p1  ORF type:complete len:403 (+),score=161.86 GHRQ01031589.1:119-1210(+)